MSYYKKIKLDVAYEVLAFVGDVVLWAAAVAALTGMALWTWTRVLG